MTSLSDTGVTSPFGGATRLLQTLSSSHIAEMYRKKSGAEISEFLQGHDDIHLYECVQTGYKFWRPEDIAGDEQFYQLLSKSWPTYYRTDRWEYSIAQKTLHKAKHVLEIGCGRGYFLKSLEGRISDAIGLEFNRDAIESKVTEFPIENQSIEEFSTNRMNDFNVIFSFQVLEHIANPDKFITTALDCLSPGGMLVLSTPNNASAILRNQMDAFDLPPHHIGHFDEATFRRIAGLYNLDVVAVHTEPRRHISEVVTDSTRNRISYKFLGMIASMAYGAAYRWCKEPGSNLLAVLRKR